MEKYTEDQLEKANYAIAEYSDICERLGINARDSVLFAIAYLYDSCDATKSQFRKLVEFTIEVSDREDAA